MPQSSLSYHMKILCEAGLVAGREDGKWTHYQISRQGGEMAFAMLREILGVKDEAAAAEYSLASKTLDQLRAYAAEKGIDLTGLTKKDDIVAAIEKAGA